VAVATEFYPEVGDADFFAQPLGPEAVRVALIHRYYVLIIELGADKLLLAPDPAAVGPFRRARAAFEELHPGGGTAILQGLNVVLDVQQAAAILASVDDVED